MKTSNHIKLAQMIADSELGGGVSHVLGLLKNLDKREFNCFLICPLGYLSAEAKKIDGVEVITIPMRSKTDIVSMVEVHSELQRIQSLDNPFGPMILHSHGPRAGLYSLTSAPHGVKKVFTEHRYDADFHLKNPINECIQKFILKQIYRHSNLVIAVSDSVKRYLLDKKLIKKDKLSVVPNAIEVTDDKIKSLPATSKNKDIHAPIIGALGNLNRQKGHSYLISAMPEILKKYPLATLEIIGEGEERANLESQIEHLRLQKHITLLGQKNEPESYMKHWDVFVMPSIAETFGIAILEAFKTGVPVVASKVGGVVDILENEENGLLIKPSDPKLIVEAIENILEHPPLAAKMRRAGEKSLKKFDWSVIIEKIERIYAEVAE